MFLGWLKEEPDKVAQCRAIIREAEIGNLTIITTALTLPEVLWMKHKDPVPKEDAEKIHAFFQHKYIYVIDLDRTLAEAAQRVVWDHSIRPKDSIHVATALDALRRVGTDFDQFDSYDTELIKKSATVGGTPPLIIAAPNLQESLLDV